MSRTSIASALGAFALVGVTSSVVAAVAQQPPPRSAAAPAPVTDETLKDRVAYRLETTPATKKYDIKVRVAGGVATLTGSVATEAQKADAGRVAKLDSISRVENNIVVDKDVDRTLLDRAKAGLSKTGDKINDAWITTKVKWFFVGDDALSGSSIDVDTANGVVTLKGTVTSPVGKARAEELAKDTEGVKRVANELTIAVK